MSFLKPPKTVTRSNKVEQFQAVLCSFGTPLINIYGTAKVNPNLINYDSKNFEAQEKRSQVGSGKAKSTQITYLYYVYVEMALGTGAFLENNVIKDVSKIWVGDKVFGSLSALNANANNEGSPLALNKGDNPNPTQYMLNHYPTTAVGYEKTAFCYGKIFLGEDNASMPSYSFEVKGGLNGSSYKGDGLDANPAYVIKDILSQIGLADSIDNESFNNYAEYCYRADLLVSTPSEAFTSQKKASEVVAELLEMTNTYMFWSTDRFKFVPRDDQRHDTWNPNKTVVYNLDEDDFIEQSGGSPVIFKRKPSEEIYNYITVNFTNRTRDYEEESISFQDLDSISTYGIRSVTYEAKWYHTKERALKYAKMRARMAQNESNQYTFQLDWKYSRLECGDLLRISCDSLNLENQIVMISEITESKDGIITVTALQRADGDYSEAQYSIKDDYIYQDFNVEPSDTRAIFVIPPADLITSANGIEVWIGLQGMTNTWGGCDVFVSDKDGDYRQAGTHGLSSIFGKINTVMTASSTTVDVTFSNPETVEILSGSQFDADNGNTLIWINGECMSYTSATLLAGKNKYRLSGLIRGQYGTKAVAHAVNDNIAMLDGGMYVLPLTKHYLNKTLYFKFPSFNVFKSNNQNMNEVDYYTCIANTADLPDCENLRAFCKYRELADDVTRYDVVVEWDVPDFDSYQQAMVWYKTSGTQADTLGVIPEGVSASELGFNNRWIYGGQGYNTVVIPQAVIGDTYKIAVCTQDIYNNTESPDTSPQVSIVVAMKTEIPNTPEGLSIQYGQEITVSWKDVRNADIKTYELRNNTIMANGLLLASTNSTTCNPALTSRSGDLYLYAVSAYDKYSAPAHITYSKSAPPAPSQPRLSARVQGLAVKMDAIPNDCYGIKLVINDVSFIISTNEYYYSCESGVYTVKYCFMDYFGEGGYSTENVETVKAHIPPELIADETITVEKLSQSAQDAIANGGVNAVNVAVKGLLGEGSALVLQPDGSYALVASNGDTLTGIFANQNGVMRLQGEYIHLTGDTVMDSDCIIKGQMVAGSIDCDQGVSINAGKLVINGDGMSFKNSANEVFTVNGRQMIGIATHGKHVTFNTEWDVIPSVMCIPRQWQTQLSTYSNTNLYTECYASNVTTRGFDVVCRTYAQAGSFSSINYNANETIVEKTIGSNTTETINSVTFTLQGNGQMSATIMGNLEARGNYYQYTYQDGLGNVWTNTKAAVITGIDASLYIDNALMETKTIWNSNTVETVTASATFENITYTDSKQAYIKYTITYRYSANLSGGLSIMYHALGGSATYKLSSSQQVATGDVTFIVSDGGNNAFYSVS